MTLPSSGQLALSQIQTEFGGANPISLSEYYGGGAYTPAGIGVPSSGQINIGVFHGKSAVDYIPDAVNWANISAIGASSASANNATQTISGITSSMVIGVGVSGVSMVSDARNGPSAVPSVAVFEVYVYKNGTKVATVDDGSNWSTSANVTVSNGDVIRFGVYGYIDIGGTATTWSYSANSTITVSNQSAGGTLDTFTTHVGSS